MDNQKQEKLQRFIADVAMSNAVYEVLLGSFLSTDYSKDNVQILAASRLSIDMLGEAWRDLQKYRAKEEVESKPDSNIGL